MPVPVEDITFSPLGPNNEISTIHRGVGWPADAENDPYTPPLSIVSFLTHNPYPFEEITP